MNILYSIVGILVVIYIAVTIWQKKREPKLEEIIVSYSEKVGETIIEHDKSYTGTLDFEKDYFKVPKLKIIRPVPPTDTFIQTISGKKIIHLVNFGIDRYGFRIPKLHNQIIVEKRDENNNVIKNKNGNPIYIKHKWLLCDDVVEPDVKHWAEYYNKELERRHATRDSMFQKWIFPMGMAIMFIFAVIVLQQTTKAVQSDKAMILERAEMMESDARETTDRLNTLIDKVTGQRVLENEQPEPP